MLATVLDMYDNQLATNLSTTCNRLVVSKLSQAMRTHSDIGLLSIRGQLVMHQCLHHVYIFSMWKIYIHDVNIDASQADRVWKWTARINKVAADGVTQEQIHIF